jgi:DNA invertase Pin-like site-specific DNA recombinase
MGYCNPAPLGDRSMQKTPMSGKARQAAAYVRMSTEFQQYSIENQSNAIQRYAALHSLLIVKRFVERGRSGLTLARRPAFRDLLREVESGAADFGNILVYDVSRWGRFQDVDESAYYEHLCKRAHVRVHYCVEAFNNDNTLYSTLIKTLKRSMAAEYSRELSVKVFEGQSHLIELGYRQGGMPGLGLRRLLVDQHGSPKGVLKAGERKALQNDRVILIPGPKDEVATVRKIFDLFTVGLKSPGEIAATLNKRGSRTDLGRAWTRGTVHDLLINPKYIGSNVFNRISRKVGEKLRRNPASMWIRRDGSFEAIVPLEKFIRAQEIVKDRSEQMQTEEQLLDRLRELWRRAGKLSSKVIEEDEASPSASTYQDRFGSLNRAYSLIGYQTLRTYTDQTMGRVLNRRRYDLCHEIRSMLETNGARAEDLKPGKVLRVNGQFTMSVYLAPCRRRAGRSDFWSIRMDHSKPMDLTVIARLQPGNREVFDYLLLPDYKPLTERLFLTEKAGKLDPYRFETLNVLPGLFKHHARWKSPGGVPKT